MHVEIITTSHSGLTMLLDQMPSFLPFIFTWVKTAVGVTLLTKGYNAFDEGHDMGDKVKKIIPYAIGLGGVFSPDLINAFLKSGSNNPLLAALSTWQFMPS